MYFYLFSNSQYDKAIARTKRLESLDEQKAAIASLTFIILNAAKFDVTDSVLSSELQQLGLPKGKNKSFNFFRFQFDIVPFLQEISSIFNFRNENRNT
jgi:hypothetical protein